MRNMEAVSTVSNKSVYIAVNNIPPFYHSADLRRFFSQFVETKGFDCFHFRHRPEHQSVKADSTSSAKTIEKPVKTFCCIIRVKENRYIDLVRTYHQRHWQDRKGESISSHCLISRLRLTGASADGSGKGRDDSGSGETNTERPAVKYRTRGEQKLIPPDREEFKEEDLLKLPELRPPPVMPNGNVGTPTQYFLKQIQECRLPPSIIKKLQLDFPKSKSKGKYGSVPFDYQTEVVEVGNDSDDDLTHLNPEHPPLDRVESAQGLCGLTASMLDEGSKPETPTSAGVNVSGVANTSNRTDSLATDSCATDKSEPQPDTTFTSSVKAKPDYKELRRLKKLEKRERRRLMDERIEEKMVEFEKGGSDSGDDNDTCEEWERHEAMYDDVTNQGRTKDRLFEEEMEIVWEKGGSGLVFYTDAQYWHEQEGDFDEQTADDLNVDMSAYYEDGAGDKDIRDFLTIRQEQRRRRGLEPTDRHTAGISKSQQLTTGGHSSGIGKFEQHTKGIGRKILEKQGWTEGEGLGSSVQGMADALDNEGQHPRDKKGLGYRGEKLVQYGLAHSQARKRRHKGEVLISTVYDSPSETDPVEKLLRRNDPSLIKHRDRIN